MKELSEMNVSAEVSPRPELDLGVNMGVSDPGENIARELFCQSVQSKVLLLPSS